ncbi:hypothetical protein DIPPA_12821 [Diplonema papillatum]|nr:hypothetical protein DIPPA_28340 [Diplonema papillatum]KAJ9458337.1 hypothetical protein DIPPA_12821 [Diplonema papillatum]
MLSLSGVVASVHAGGRSRAVKGLECTSLSKKTSTYINCVETTIRKSTVVTADVTTHVEAPTGRTNLRVNLLFDTGLAAEMAFEADSPDADELRFTDCSCNTANQRPSHSSIACAGRVPDSNVLYWSAAGDVTVADVSFSSAGGDSKKKLVPSTSSAHIGLGASLILAGSVHGLAVVNGNRVFVTERMPEDRTRPARLESRGEIADLPAFADRVWAAQWVEKEANRACLLATTKPAPVTPAGQLDPFSPGTPVSAYLVEELPEQASLFVVDVKSRSIERKASFRVPGAVCAAAGTPDASAWVVGCKNGALLLRNREHAAGDVALRGTAGRTAACIHITQTLVFVGHTTPTLAVYDYGLNPVRIILDGVSAGPFLSVQRLFACDTSVAALSTSGELPAGKNAAHRPTQVTLCVVGRGGPVALLKASGTVGHNCLLKAALDDLEKRKHRARMPNSSRASFQRVDDLRSVSARDADGMSDTTTDNTFSPRRGGGHRVPDPLNIAAAGVCEHDYFAGSPPVRLVRSTPRHMHLALLSQVVLWAYRTGDDAVVDEVLADFSCAFVPEEGAARLAGERGSDGHAFVALFRRFFVEKLRVGDVLAALGIAMKLRVASWCDEVVQAAKGHCLDAAAVELCLSLSSPALRTNCAALREFVKDHTKTLKREARAKTAADSPRADSHLQPHDPNPQATMLRLLDQLSSAQAPAFNLKATIRLIRLVSLYKSFSQGQALLRQFIQRAHNEGRDADAAELKARLAQPEVAAIYAEQ